MLDEIVAHKKRENGIKQKEVPLSEIKELSTVARPTRDFKSALSKVGISMIAEVKMKSPSKGILKNNFNHLEIAKLYAKAGVSAISVLGDKHFFGGGSEIVKTVAIEPEINVPVMFKDFIISEYQVYEARVVHADAVLLIVRIMDQKKLELLINKAKDLKMAALVETFDEIDVKRALKAGADIIGINNRDLDTFRINFNKTSNLMQLIPNNIVTVSESGIHTRKDVQLMKEMGFDAMLIGESIIQSDDVISKINEFLS
ncbi:indole-3-glycerol phosphate synthase TrpC [Brenneria tiliae]|uniref:indole-3-glycerol phosphate synthase TrpC n=1 Tax=Brenneria tiliae TaxID=2914984 RepID=UPI002014EB0E|nr:indole-3-glycerol phosphate synthase TrpC [Brenneria tiliae]MCL2897116.1 indole-3-glycerol phosphate synthase TrpC [Brenneria tiliae]MCL2904769.1 indole-3-glycerol phosphate synthase TrpC [Brenneria tiliae]